MTKQLISQHNLNIKKEDEMLVQGLEVEDLNRILLQLLFYCSPGDLIKNTNKKQNQKIKNLEIVILNF